MYANYWGLEESPFQNTTDPRWYHASPFHEEALARLFFLIEEHRSCGALLGAAGAGKSMLLRILGDQVRRSQRKLISLDLLGMEGQELLWRTSEAFRLGSQESESHLMLWRRLEDCLAGLDMASLQVVLLCDHLERADRSCLHVLERLHALDARYGGRITFLFAARERHSRELSLFLEEVSELRIDLPPFDYLQSQACVRELLVRAGARRELFEPAALEALYTCSSGIPRDLRRLCDLSLLAAMGEQLSKVDEQVVLSVAAELRPQPYEPLSMSSL